MREAGRLDERAAGQRRTAPEAVPAASPRRFNWIRIAKRLGVATGLDPETESAGEVAMARENGLFDNWAEDAAPHPH